MFSAEGGVCGVFSHLRSEMTLTLTTGLADFVLRTHGCSALAASLPRVQGGSLLCPDKPLASASRHQEHADEFVVPKGQLA